MKQIICITCPKGCRLTVDENNHFAVTGNGCRRGIQYALDELQHPTRTLTSTVRIHNADIPRLPVKSKFPLPKETVLQVMALLDCVDMQAPVVLGQTVLSNVLDTGIDIVATRSLPLANDV